MKSRILLVSLAFLFSGCYVNSPSRNTTNETQLEEEMAGQVFPDVPRVSEEALKPVRFIYVDCNNPNAKDDPANGSESNPFKTIHYAANLAEPGDHIIVKKGTYNERITVRRSGKTNSYIVFKGDNMPACKGFVLLSNCIAVIGFEMFDEEPYLGYYQGGGVWAEGNYLYIANNYITNFLDSAGVMCKADMKSSYVHISNNYIYYCNKGMSISGNYYLVEYNKIERLHIGPESNDCDFFRFFGENLVFYRNVMFGNKKEEIGDSHVDFFQTFDNNGFYARNVLITENIGCGFFHQGLMFSGTDKSHRNITFYRNVFANGASWGFCCRGGSGVYIINNTIYNSGINGCGFGYKNDKSSHTSGAIKNNIFAYCTASYFADDPTNVVWETGYNIIYQCRDMPKPSNSTDLLRVDPLFRYTGNPSNITINDLLGPDGKPFTSDDGLNVLSNSPALGGGENGSNIGAY